MIPPNQTFRGSLYATVCVGAVGLWMGEDNAWPYPWVVVLCAIAAHAFTDHWQVVVIPRFAVPCLSAIALGYFAWEEASSFRTDPLLPLGHLCISLQLILMFHRKNQRFYWWLLLLGFLEVPVAAVHNNTFGFGLLVAVYLALVVWTLTQFSLLRESERHHHGLAAPAVNRWPLKRAALSSAGLSLAALLLGLLFFLLIPRRGQAVWTQSVYRAPQYLTGFDERVQLGQLGTILESDEEVMSVRLFDENGRALMPSDEPLWRGVALTRYEDGRWERSRTELDPDLSPWGVAPRRFIRQEIWLRAGHRDVLFGLRPSFAGQTRSGEPLGTFRSDGTLVRPEGVAPGPLHYTVDSRLETDEAPRPEIPAGSQFDTRRELTQVPDAVRAQLREYVATLGLNTSDPDRLAEQLLEHLQNANVFDYTLRGTVSDPSIDPVLDFLVNRKEGHCEYFASALALMLRAHGVPARLINGFKGGDRTELIGRSLVVRQKHAHSWVEAIVGVPSRPRWIVLDPTPGAPRERVVAQVNRTPSFVRQMRDASQQLWSSYVLNFNATEQEAAIYGPVREQALRQLQSLKSLLQGKFSTRTRGFNWFAACLASSLVAIIVVIVRMAVRLVLSGKLRTANGASTGRGWEGWWIRMLRAVFRRWVGDSAGASRRVAFYDELLEILESVSLYKEPCWTPRQFAEHAAVQLRPHPHASRAALIPLRIIDSFYQVRFGNKPLTSAQSGEIEQMLSALATALKKKE